MGALPDLFGDELFVLSIRRAYSPIHSEYIEIRDIQGWDERAKSNNIYRTNLPYLVLPAVGIGPSIYSCRTSYGLVIAINRRVQFTAIAEALISANVSIRHLNHKLT
jgi:hypothetical protein